MIAHLVFSAAILAQESSSNDGAGYAVLAVGLLLGLLAVVRPSIRSKREDAPPK